MLADVEDRHDVGVVQPRRRARLQPEPLELARCRIRTVPGQDLQRHVAAERLLDRLVDDPHPPAADLAEDPVVAQPLGMPAPVAAGPAGSLAGQARRGRA